MSESEEKVKKRGFEVRVAKYGKVQRKLSLFGVFVCGSWKSLKKNKRSALVSCQRREREEREEEKEEERSERTRQKERRERERFVVE